LEGCRCTGSALQQLIGASRSVHVADQLFTELLLALRTLAVGQ
jgi:hypothetical protein